MKKFAVWMIIVPIIALIFLPGCGQQETATTTTTSTTTTTYASYFPLIVGRVITYEVTTHSETEDATTHQIIVTDETTYETWQYAGFVPLTSTLEVFKINVIYGGSDFSDYYREDSTGVYFHGSGSQPTTESNMILKYPLEVGTTWESEWMMWGPNSVQAEENITTPAGTFTCRKVRYQEFVNNWHYAWYAKDIGLIKRYSGLGGTVYIGTTCEVISKNF